MDRTTKKAKQNIVDASCTPSVCGSGVARQEDTGHTDRSLFRKLGEGLHETWRGARYVWSEKEVLDGRWMVSLAISGAQNGSRLDEVWIDGNTTRTLVNIFSVENQRCVRKALRE